ARGEPRGGGSWLRAGAVVREGKRRAQAGGGGGGGGVARLVSERGFTPGLAVVLVGDNPASQVYVRNKASATREVGMRSIECTLPADISQEGLLDAVRDLNRRGDVHGILVQLPLPRHIDPTTVIEAIDPAKDVDGFHPLNLGRMAFGLKGLVPCTPRACLRLIKTHCSDLAGLKAVVIGRSNIVGKPMALLLLAENCTVTVAHSRTLDLAKVVRSADVVVAAVGKPEMVRGDWLKEGAIVI